jgi:hypothetical protein
MSWERWGWAAIISAAIALEAHTLREQTEDNNDTFTEVSRLVFHTDTLVGRAVFQIVLEGAARWFGPHTLAQGSTRALKGLLP